MIGGAGVIVIEDSTINNLANYFFSDTAGLVIAAIATGLFAFVGHVRGRQPPEARDPHGQPRDRRRPSSSSFAAAIFGAVIWANSERGFPLAFLLVIIFLVFWTWVAERTTFGRHVYAVGGNAEAARRAGINVPRIRVLVFMISRPDGRRWAA